MDIVLSLVVGLLASACCRRFDDFDAFMFAKKPVLCGEVDGVYARSLSGIVDASGCWVANESLCGEEGIRADWGN